MERYGERSNKLVIRRWPIVRVRSRGLQDKGMPPIFNLFAFTVLPSVHAFAIAAVNRLGRRRPERWGGGASGVNLEGRDSCSCWRDRGISPIRVEMCAKVE